MALLHGSNLTWRCSKMSTIVPDAPASIYGPEKTTRQVSILEVAILAETFSGKLLSENLHRIRSCPKFKANFGQNISDENFSFQFPPRTTHENYGYTGQ
jgi:hypothetical protein